MVPTFNQADLISETIDSVLAQTYSDQEIIVVDDGSTDHTASVLQRYGEAVRVIRKKNGGTASARNAGIQAARGEFIAFVDSDDLWLPNKLAKQVQLLDARPEIGWAYCDAEMFDGSTGAPLARYGKLFPPAVGEVASVLALRCFVASPTPIVRRTLFDDAGLFDEEDVLRLREDWAMWLRLAASHRIGYLQEVLARYRVHLRNKTRHEDPMDSYEGHRAALDKALEFCPAAYRRIYPKAVCKVANRSARALLFQERVAEARFLLRVAWKHDRYNIETILLLQLSLLGKRAYRLLRSVLRTTTRA